MTTFEITHPLTNVSYRIKTAGTEVKVSNSLAIDLTKPEVRWAEGSGGHESVAITVGLLQVSKTIMEVSEQGGTLTADSIEVALIGQLSD